MVVVVMALGTKQIEARQRTLEVAFTIVVDLAALLDCYQAAVVVRAETAVRERRVCLHVVVIDLCVWTLWRKAIVRPTCVKQRQLLGALVLPLAVKRSTVGVSA